MQFRAVTAMVLALLLTFAVAGKSGGDDKDAAPLDREYPRLVAQSVPAIREALKGKPTRREADKARIAAMLIAAAAQRNFTGPDGSQRATVRDAALALADFIRNENFEQARKLAAVLPDLKPDSRAKKERVKLLGPRLDVEDLMMQYRPVKVGGWGLEAKFDMLGSQPNGTIAAKELNAQLRLDAYLTAVTAELAAEHKPKTKAEQWLIWAQDMRKQAAALGEAVKAGDGKAGFEALTRLNRTCNQCHQAFRNN